MKYRKILLTGGTGTLGQHILKSGLFKGKGLTAPTHHELDITNSAAVELFFAKNDFDAVIHCAAMARVIECEKDPAKAIETNIVGTANLVAATIKKEDAAGKKIRLVHISTDGVYPSTKGNYSEKDTAAPYNKYGWTKLGAEAAVNTLANFCIIRTRFFNPENIKYEAYATDAYTSMLPVDELVRAIAKMLDSNFAGTINIGGERKADYDVLKKHKPSIQPCKFDDLQRKTPFKLSKDASMDVSLWKKVKGAKYK